MLLIAIEINIVIAFTYVCACVVDVIKLDKLFCGIKHTATVSECVSACARMCVNMYEERLFVLYTLKLYLKCHVI